LVVFLHLNKPGLWLVWEGHSIGLRIAERTRPVGLRVLGYPAGNQPVLVKITLRIVPHPITHCAEELIGRP